MREKSRSENVAKNTAATLVTQGIKNLLSFLSRTVFIYVLGAEYLGVNGLFSQILSILSFAELGIGNALVFSMYKPLAENDKEKLKSLMALYAKAYRVIGLIILGLGIAIIPFVPRIVGDVQYIHENLILLYILSLLSTVSTYFLVYKQSMLIADQKMYVVNINTEIFHALAIVTQTIFLLVTREYIVYLLISIFWSVANNVWISYRADRIYPYLKEKNVKPLEKSELQNIVKNVKALFLYKVSTTILESTDNIFISVLINVVTVGLYSNYRMIVDIFKTIGTQVMNSVVASVGNLQATADAKKKTEVFYEILFVCAWFFGFATSGLYVFLSDFIEIWVGKAYLLSTVEVLAICSYFYVSNMHYASYTFRTTAGLFVAVRYIPLITASINVVLDIFLGRKFGLSGILWASVISRALTVEITDPYIIQKNILVGKLTTYWAKYGIYLFVVVAETVVLGYFVNQIMLSGFIGLLIKAIIYAIVYNAVFLLVFCKTREERSMFTRICKLLKVIT